MLNTQNMNLDYIRTFVVLGQVKTLSDTAKKVNMDISNVRRHISSLEDIMKTKLFTKKGSIYELTEDGKKLFDGFEKGYNTLLLAEKDYVQSKSLNSGKLSIGVANNIDFNMINELIIKFKQKYNNVIIKVSILPTNNLFEKLSQYNLDLIIDGSLDNTNTKSVYNTNHIYNEEFCIAYSSKNKELKDISELSNLPLILPTSSKVERHIFDKLLSDLDIKESLSIEIDNYESMLEYLKNDFGYALIPKRLVSNTDLNILELDLKKDISVWYIKDYLSPTAKMFIQELKS